MRILHTSDWHLGATLEGFHSRDEEHRRFLGWLRGTLREREVDVLVVAGDVFDHAQPTAEAQRRYYRFLAELADSPLRKVVIVGGNHDSAARLDAPRELLGALDVHVVGGITRDDDWARCLCPVAAREGAATELVVVAVPYFHEFRLGVRTALESPAEIAREFQDKLRERYHELADGAEALGQGAPLVATGHLTCLGWEPGDAPQDIHQVGTLGALPPSVFDARFQHVALGHLHRCFRVAESRAWYSGSPLPLALKEAKVQRRVLLVETTEGGAARVEKLTVPLARDLVLMEGDERTVRDKLAALRWETPLPPLVYAEVEVTTLRTGLEQELERALAAHGDERPLLARVTQRTDRRGQEGATLAAGGERVSLRELAPEQVFERLCRDRGEVLDEPLRAAFLSLLAGDEDPA